MSDSVRYLFISDSVTDCARLDPTDGLGDGYVNNLKGHLAAHSGIVVNRGLSGNRVVDLLAAAGKLAA